MAIFAEEPGWSGAFSRNQAPGAHLNGSRVVKVACDAGDAHPIGALATVLGSLSDGVRTGYFVEWDARPRTAVFVVDYKIKPV